MVREGKMATVTACKEAEVKRPIEGVTRTPVQGNVIDGTVMAREVQEVGAVSSVPVRKAGQEVGEITTLHFQKSEKQAERVSRASVLDVEIKAGVRKNCSVPVQWVERQGKVSKVSAIPVLEQENMPVVQEHQPVRVDSSLTLSQLFSEKK